MESRKEKRLEKKTKRNGKEEFMKNEQLSKDGNLKNLNTEDASKKEKIWCRDCVKKLAKKKAKNNKTPDQNNNNKTKNKEKVEKKRENFSNGMEKKTNRKSVGKDKDTSEVHCFSEHIPRKRKVRKNLSSNNNRGKSTPNASRSLYDRIEMAPYKFKSSSRGLYNKTEQVPMSLRSRNYNNNTERKGINLKSTSRGFYSTLLQKMTSKTSFMHEEIDLADIKRIKSRFMEKKQKFFPYSNQHNNQSAALTEERAPKKAPCKFKDYEPPIELLSQSCWSMKKKKAESNSCDQRVKSPTSYKTECQSDGCEPMNSYCKYLEQEPKCCFTDYYDPCCSYVRPLLNFPETKPIFSVTESCEPTNEDIPVYIPLNNDADSCECPPLECPPLECPPPCCPQPCCCLVSQPCCYAACSDPCPPCCTLCPTSCPPPPPPPSCLSPSPPPPLPPSSCPPPLPPSSPPPSPCYMYCFTSPSCLPEKPLFNDCTFGVPPHPPPSEQSPSYYVCYFNPPFCLPLKNALQGCPPSRQIISNFMENISHNLEEFRQEENLDSNHPKLGIVFSEHVEERLRKTLSKCNDSEKTLDFKGFQYEPGKNELSHFCEVLSKQNIKFTCIDLDDGKKENSKEISDSEKQTSLDKKKSASNSVSLTRRALESIKSIITSQHKKSRSKSQQSTYNENNKLNSNIEENITSQKTSNQNLQAQSPEKGNSQNQNVKENKSKQSLHKNNSNMQNSNKRNSISLQTDLLQRSTLPPKKDTEATKQAEQEVVNLHVLKEVIRVIIKEMCLPQVNEQIKERLCKVSSSQDKDLLEKSKSKKITCDYCDNNWRPYLQSIKRLKDGYKTFVPTQNTTRNFNMTSKWEDIDMKELGMVMNYPCTYGPNYSSNSNNIKRNKNYKIANSETKFNLKPRLKTNRSEGTLKNQSENKNENNNTEKFDECKNCINEVNEGIQKDDPSNTEVSCSELNLDEKDAYDNCNNSNSNFLMIEDNKESSRIENVKEIDEFNDDEVEEKSPNLCLSGSVVKVEQKVACKGNKEDKCVSTESILTKCRKTLKILANPRSKNTLVKNKKMNKKDAIEKNQPKCNTLAKRFSCFNKNIKKRSFRLNKNFSLCRINFNNHNKMKRQSNHIRSKNDPKVLDWLENKVDFKKNLPKNVLSKDGSADISLHLLHNITENDALKEKMIAEIVYEVKNFALEQLKSYFRNPESEWNQTLKDFLTKNKTPIENKENIRDDSFDPHYQKCSIIRKHRISPKMGFKTPKKCRVSFSQGYCDEKNKVASFCSEDNIHRNQTHSNSHSFIHADSKHDFNHDYYTDARKSVSSETIGYSRDRGFRKDYSDDERGHYEHSSDPCTDHNFELNYSTPSHPYSNSWNGCNKNPKHVSRSDSNKYYNKKDSLSMDRKKSGSRNRFLNKVERNMTSQRNNPELYSYESSQTLNNSTTRRDEPAFYSSWCQRSKNSPDFLKSRPRVHTIPQSPTNHYYSADGKSDYLKNKKVHKDQPIRAEPYEPVSRSHSDRGIYPKRSDYPEPHSDKQQPTKIYLHSPGISQAPRYESPLQDKPAPVNHSDHPAPYLSQNNIHPISLPYKHPDNLVGNPYNQKSQLENNQAYSHNHKTYHHPHTSNHPAHQSPHSVHQPTHQTHQPTHLLHQPTNPIHQPTNPTHQPTYPAHQPTHPAHQPTLPIHQPTHPAHQPTLQAHKQVTTNHSNYHGYSENYYKQLHHLPTYRPPSQEQYLTPSQNNCFNNNQSCNQVYKSCLDWLAEDFNGIKKANE